MDIILPKQKLFKSGTEKDDDFFVMNSKGAGNGEGQACFFFHLAASLSRRFFSFMARWLRTSLRTPQ